MTIEQPEDTVEAPQDDVDATIEETPEEDTPEESEDRGGREARYRRQLRDTEAQLALVRARLDDANTREVEMYASALGDPKDLFTLTGTSADDYLDDDGLVDAEKVRQAVDEILRKRPGLTRRDPAVDGLQGVWGDTTAQPSWSGLLAPE